MSETTRQKAEPTRNEWMSALVLPLVFMLIGTKLNADSGPLWLAVCGLAMVWGLIATAIRWPWIRSSALRTFGSVILSLGITLGLVWYFWIPTLNVFPGHVKFDGSVGALGSNQTYEFTLKNSSEHDIFSAEVTLKVEDTNASIHEIEIGVPKDSRIPLGEGGRGAEKFADINGFRCRSPKTNLLYNMSVEKMRPQESRHILVTYTGKTPLVVSAKTEFFSREPQAVRIDGDKVIRPAHFDAETDSAGCFPFGFMVDAAEYNGMFYPKIN
jgi:hypothetical protein